MQRLKRAAAPSRRPVRLHHAGRHDRHVPGRAVHPRRDQRRRRRHPDRPRRPGPQARPRGRRGRPRLVRVPARRRPDLLDEVHERRRPRRPACPPPSTRCGTAAATTRASWRFLPGQLGREVHDRAAPRQPGRPRATRPSRRRRCCRTTRCASAPPAGCGARSARSSPPSSARASSTTSTSRTSRRSTRRLRRRRHAGLGPGHGHDPGPVREVLARRPRQRELLGPAVHGDPVHHGRRDQRAVPHERLDPDQRQPGLRPHRRQDRDDRRRAHGLPHNGGGTPVVQGPKTVPAAPLDLPPDNALAEGARRPRLPVHGQDQPGLPGRQGPGDQRRRRHERPDGAAAAERDHLRLQRRLRQVVHARAELHRHPDGCGNAWVQGTYSKGVTVAAENDVIINEDLIHTGDGMLGPDRQPVRARLPPGQSTRPTRRRATAPTTSATSGSTRRSCRSTTRSSSTTTTGRGRGDADRQRRDRPEVPRPGRRRAAGAACTATSRTTPTTTACAYEEPPNFLDPVQTAWRMVRATEQTPPR